MAFDWSSPSTWKDSIGLAPASDFAKLSPMFSVAGALTSAYSSFAAARSQQRNLEFQSQMSAINAQMAEKQAQTIMLSAEKQIGQVTLRAGKSKSASRASMAARGIQLGVGNAAETEVAIDLAKETDAIVINSNAVRAANAARTQAVNYGNQSLLEGVTAGTISPMSAGISSLMTTATTLGSQWYQDNKLAALLQK